MTFLERLRTYLERVARAPEGLPFVYIDVAAHRRHLLEKAYTQSAIGRERQTHLIAHESEFRAFVVLVGGQILEELNPDATSEQLADFIDRALVQLFEAEPRLGRQTDSEIARIAFSAWGRRNDDGALDGWPIAARYAFETRLVQRRVARVTLAKGGAALLELPGADAVRWLLALESSQSLGPWDDWRASPEMAALLLEEPRRDAVATKEVAFLLQFSPSSLRRLAALGLVNYFRPDPKHGYLGGYEVPAYSRGLLGEIAQRQSTPFAVLAQALLSDDLDRAMARLSPAYERVAHESVAATVALQARMVVHEVRNALIPAQMALESLALHLGEAALAEPALRLRRRIENGMGRALNFVDEMLQVANLGDEPPSVFDACEAVRKAAAGAADMLNGNLHVTTPEGPRLVFGPRSRFVPAIVNLLRNASQAIAGRDANALQGRVELTFGDDEANVVIYVDDNGPGVPPEQRQAIFEPGVALRSGGSGQGLALVRHVVETEMGGVVRCEEGPLGGARFMIAVPARSTEST